MNKGMSLIEILMTMTIFALLGMIVTSAIALSMKGTRKGESTIKVRESLDYALAIIERQLRNAEKVEPCSNSDPHVLNYLDRDGAATSFSCVGVGGADGYLASGSARLTTTDAAISACSLVCQTGTYSTPPQVQVDLTSGSVTLTTKIDLRTY